jgi:alpha-D-ribose 1-methylphosphonate 5-triphosphate synthase subunit PhnL
VQHDIDILLAAAGLTHKADHLATSLSGGNVRKLSLLMALIGDRPLVLIDEFSSGVDSFSKREAWRTVSLSHIHLNAKRGPRADALAGEAHQEARGGADDPFDGRGRGTGESGRRHCF